MALHESFLVRIRLKRLQHALDLGLEFVATVAAAAAVVVVGSLDADCGAASAAEVPVAAVPPSPKPAAVSLRFPANHVAGRESEQSEPRSGQARLDLSWLISLE